MINWATVLYVGIVILTAVATGLCIYNRSQLNLVCQTILKAQTVMDRVKLAGHFRYTMVKTLLRSKVNRTNGYLLLVLVALYPFIGVLSVKDWVLVSIASIAGVMTILYETINVELTTQALDKE